MQHNIADLRNEYSQKELSEQDISQDPVQQFKAWFADALDCKVKDANAMALATVDGANRPSCRIVLLKGVDQRGFSFFTNYESRKGLEIEKNPYAAITFFWKELERQVRIEGRIEKLPAPESDKYFASRPKGSRIGAWASPQSQPITRQELIAKEAAFRQKYDGKAVERPEYWGGYLLLPDKIEFWQGRPNRLHDRLLYHKTGEAWQITRLAP